MKFVVTGGRGFIGSHFVELLLENGHQVIDIDKMTYAAFDELPWDNDKNYKLIVEDISNITHLPPCDVVVNFAAESHVDNSIESPKEFFKSNSKGVFNLLELIRGKVYERPLFVQISTDEVYGDIRDESFKEDSVLNPGNPYSASKAAAEMFVLSYNKTFGIDYLITRSSNNYGLRQYNEKLIPKIISSLKENKKIPLHGDGSYIRDWINVKDNVEAIYHLIVNDYKNSTFNIGANNHLTNLEVVKIVSSWFDIVDYQKNISFVPNRLGQDIRYSINFNKLLETNFNFKYNNKNNLHKFIK